MLDTFEAFVVPIEFGIDVVDVVLHREHVAANGDQLLLHLPNAVFDAIQVRLNFLQDLIEKFT
ncbi:MAG: hypothetical protein ABS58_14720 [Mesorhizobium sp. SCN 65-20]|nr:MAG: hypothetical protein ABS58_14720 [Mesorhizobium sp. SCN 65-20]